jgi:hypothetical protein
MNGYAESLSISPARWKALAEKSDMSDVRSILSRRIAILVLGFATALLLSGPASAAEPSDLETKLTITVGGVEKTLTLEEAMDALNIPSVSLALIDRDRVAFARALAPAATPRRSIRRRVAVEIRGGGRRDASGR